MGPWITRVYLADCMGKAMHGANAKDTQRKTQGANLYRMAGLSRCFMRHVLRTRPLTTNCITYYTRCTSRTHSMYVQQYIITAHSISVNRSCISTKPYML